jgi:RND family efflux transporter MFP subunit
MSFLIRWRPWLIAVATLILLVLLIAANLSAAKAPKAKQPQQVAAPEVRVITVEAQSHSVQVNGYGSARSRFQHQLTSPQSGRVVALSEAFESGRQVQPGEWLVKLENSSQAAALASAERELADARVALLEEERSSQQAKNEWQASHLGEPESELVLRQPQLQAAKARLAEAKALVAQARQQLRDTEIRAPYAAVVSQRSVAKGDYLTAGSVLGELLSTELMYVRVPLSLAQWQRLPSREQLMDGLWQAWLSDVESGQRWPAVVAQVDRHIDAEQRQRAITLAVERPLQQAEPLYSGTFVAAQLMGDVAENVWQLPASALSQDGDIWYITEQQYLAKVAATVVASDEQGIYVEVPEALHHGTTQVVLQPLSSYLPDMAVVAVEAEEVSHVAGH